MAIKDWAIDDQPREKLLAGGPATLTDAELLAIFLRTGCRGQSAVDIANTLIDHYGGLRGLLAADINALKQALGLGTVKSIQLKAVLEIARRYLDECLQRGQQLSSPQDTRDYLLLNLRDRHYEVFMCLFLDNKNRVILLEEMFRGTIDAANVYPREVAKRALELNAAALILAHNHPSGNPDPSPEDIIVTRQIRAAADMMDIELLDHIIIGSGQRFVSLKDKNLGF